MNLSDIIRTGQDELESDRLEESEKTFVQALQTCRTVEERQEVLRWLLRLAGKYIRKGQRLKPKALYDYLSRADVQERTRILELLARLHHQSKDLANAANIYVDIFEERAISLGSEHPDTVGALKTAALFTQMQGKSTDTLYARANQISGNPEDSDNAGNSTGITSARTSPETPKSNSFTRNLKEVEAFPGNEKQSNHSPGGRKKNEDKPGIADGVPPYNKPDNTMEDQVLQARKRSTKKTNTLFLLDALIGPDKAEEKPTSPEEIPEFLSAPLTVESNLQELIAGWEPFCNQIAKKLVKLLQQHSNLAYRNTLAKLSSLLSEQKGVKQVNLEHPFLSSSRRSESNYLDWSILKELAPVFAAYDGSSQTYAIEIATIYACLRRAFELGPLHVDTLESLYRLSHIYAQELFGCYDIEFAAAGFRICLLAFRDHPEISELTRIRCRVHLAIVLMAKDELQQAKERLKEAVQLADACEQVSRGELIAILRTLAECTNKMEDYDTAISVYERLRNFQEAVSKDAELFETFVQLFRIYRKAGNEKQMYAYNNRLIWELDQLSDANPMRETIASKAMELEELGLAEKLLDDIIMNSQPSEPVAGRAVKGLIKIFEKTGRDEMARELKELMGGKK